MNSISLILVIVVCALGGCSHGKNNHVTVENAARIRPELVREAVVFEPGTQEGAVVPEVSAPRLRAIWIAERIEGNRLIEKHREWILEGDVRILGTATGPTRGTK